MVTRAALRKHYHNKVDKKLIFRQRIFLIIILILTVINIGNVLINKVSIGLTILDLTIAILLGYFFSRMTKISWDSKKKKIVSELDAIGIAIILVYLVVELMLDWFLGHWFSCGTLATYSLIFATGLLIGRLIGTFRRINNVLTEVIIESFR